MARAQGISGVVTDSSGTAVPGTDVTAKNASTGFEFHTVTDARGAYTLPSVPAGTYTVTFKLSGFRFTVREGVTVTSAGTAIVQTPDVSMNPCSLSGFSDDVKCVSNEEMAAGVPSKYRPLWTRSYLDDRNAFRAGLPYDSITLQRGGFFLFSPGAAFTVTLHRDGSAELTSEEEMSKPPAKYSGSVDLFGYGKLCYFIEEQHLERLAPLYAEGATDSPTFTVKLAMGKRAIIISDYGSVGPIELFAVQELIDSARHRIEWKPEK